VKSSWRACRVAAQDQGAHSLGAQRGDAFRSCLATRRRRAARAPSAASSPLTGLDFSRRGRRGGMSRGTARRADAPSGRDAALFDYFRIFLFFSALAVRHLVGYCDLPLDGEGSHARGGSGAGGDRRRGRDGKRKPPRGEERSGGSTLARATGRKLTGPANSIICKADAGGGRATPDGPNLNRDRERGEAASAAKQRGPADDRWRGFCMVASFERRVDAWTILCSNSSTG